jgi:hypothetical protein
MSKFMTVVIGIALVFLVVAILNFLGADFSDTPYDRLRP